MSSSYSPHNTTFIALIIPPQCNGSYLEIMGFIHWGWTFVKCLNLYCPHIRAPNYREKSIVNQKGWSSERVLQPTSSSRRQASVGVASLTPFNSERTIPSKWDDAERWICSPVSGYANNKSCYAQQHQRRPKSKSGPIVPPGTAITPIIHLQFHYAKVW
ncbi:hypothetical protein SESBI_15401 [Sesbania bispinosa]|nr:hypothetical protein SESBI_15401 [Sesbania bispinosa]